VLHCNMGSIYNRCSEDNMLIIVIDHTSYRVVQVPTKVPGF